MTQSPLPLISPDRPRKRRPSLTDQLEAYLLARVGQFVAVMDMAAVVGTSGVRQRRLECEQRGVRLQKPGEYRDGRYGFVVLGRASEGRAA